MCSIWSGSLNCPDIFVFDRLTQAMSLISKSSSGQQSNAYNNNPIILADGRYVVFDSAASNLVPNDTNICTNSSLTPNCPDVFVRDLQTGETKRVSVASDGSQGNDSSFGQSISADGRFIAYMSAASNLVSGDTNNSADTFVYDQQTGQTIRVSIASDGSQAETGGTGLISSSGRFVLFASASTNLTGQNGKSCFFVRDLETQTTSLINMTCVFYVNIFQFPLKISSDGQTILFISSDSTVIPNDTNGKYDIFSYYKPTNKVTRMSTSSDGLQSNGDSRYGSMSNNGRYVVFESNATNLVINDTNGGSDIFAHENDIPPVFAISGRVVDGSNDGIAGVTIVADAGGILSVTTNASGYYTVTDLITGTYTLTPTKNGLSLLPPSRTVSVPPSATGQNFRTPFLDLPVSYSNFAQAVRGNVDGNSGRVNSWFDHTSPNYSENNNLTRWDGRVFAFTASSPSRIGESWYDGHNGIDFRHNTSVLKEPIYAAAPGIVTRTVTTCVEGDRPCGDYYGNQVWIDHGNGYATLYGHLQAVSVTVGTQITNIISRPLGIMGNTGKSVGTHLHFGNYYDQNSDGQWTQNEVVDPYGWSGQNSDPWTVPSQYSWKYSLQTQQVVNDSGGTVTSPSGNTSVFVPAGTLTSTITLELWDTPPAAESSAQLRSIGQSFLLRVLEWLTGGEAATHSAHALTSSSFAQPVTVTVSYSDTAVLHLNESLLTIKRWDEINNAWISLSTTVNTNLNQAEAQTTETGNFDMQAPLVCPADITEPNDDYYAAVNTLTNGTSVSSLFDGIQDEDWFKFDTRVGDRYIIQTDNLATGVDTVMQIYDMDGLTLLTSNDNGGGGQASYLTWQAPLDGTYFIRIVRASGSAFGCSAAYELSVTQVQPPSSVVIAGPTAGFVQTGYTFTATVSPITTTLPITYVWQATEQLSMTNTGSLSDTVTFTWTTSGPQSIIVKAINEGGVASSTHAIAVGAGPLVNIAVTPSLVTVTVGVTRAFTAAGADAFGNSVLISPTWSSDVGSMTDNVLTVQTTPISGRHVTATVGNLSGTAVVNVMAGPLVNIMVTPNPVTVTVGMTQTLTTTGADAFGNSMPISPIWSTDAGTMTGTVLTAQTTPASGRHITATVGSIRGTASVNIIAGSLYSVVVTPRPVTLTVGVTRTFTASGADAFGNSVSISPTWSTDAGSMTGGALTTQTMPANSKHVTSTVGNLSDTITFDVVAGPLSRLTITPTNVTLAMHTTQQFTAAGFDVYNNVITQPSIGWQVAPIDVGVIDAAGWFTAGNKAGVYPHAIIIASGNISATAQVIVRWPYQVYLPVVLR